MFDRVAQSARSNIRDLQRLMNLMRPSVKLLEDGKFGTVTSAAIGRLDPEQRKLLESLQGSRPIVDVPVVQPTSVQTNAALLALIRAEAARQGVPVSTALTFANAESRFNPNARSSTGAIGLYQLTDIAVRDVRQASSEYISPPGGDRTDPAWNARIGIAYIKRCAQLAKVDVRDTSASALARIYAAYNIGIGSLQAIDRGNFGSPVLLDSIGKQARELKQDGASGYLAAAARWIESYRLT